MFSRNFQYNPKTFAQLSELFPLLLNKYGKILYFDNDNKTLVLYLLCLCLRLKVVIVMNVILCSNTKRNVMLDKLTVVKTNTGVTSIIL